MKGPEREDLIGWVTQCWKEIDKGIIVNAFKKARLYDYQLKVEARVEPNEVDDASSHLNDYDIDDPYLDEIEEEILYRSDLILESELINRSK